MHPCLIVMKQKIAIFLTGTLLIGLFNGTALAAKPEMQLELQFTPASVGETATAQLVCENNPGLAAVQLTLAFDETVLDCTNVSTGPALRGMMGATNPNGESGAIVAAASASSVEQDGVLAYFDFVVLQDGDCKFTLVNTYFTLEDGTRVSFAVSGLDQAVEEDKPSMPVEPGEPTQPGETVSGETVPGGTIPVEPPSGGTADTPTSGQEESTKITFHDIAGHWAEEYVMTAVDRGLVNGYPDGGVHPDDLMTRAEFVTLLWRHAGEPQPTAPSTFVDLSPGAYYLDAVAWAQEVGYVNGMTLEQFDPQGLINREMVVTVLHRISGLVTGGELLWTSIYDKAFTDSETVSDWAKRSVYWSVYNDILCGRGSATVGDILHPRAAATRAEIMVMLINYQDGIGGMEA